MVPFLARGWWGVVGGSHGFPLPLGPAASILLQHPILLTVGVQYLVAQEKNAFHFPNGFSFSFHTNLCFFDTTFLVNVKIYRK